MALSIKSDEADRLARQLASVTGETITDAVVTALRERLERHQQEGSLPRRARIRRLVDEVAMLPTLDRRTPDEILGYDEHGLPA